MISVSPTFPSDQRLAADRETRSLTPLAFNDAPPIVIWSIIRPENRLTPKPQIDWSKRAKEIRAIPTLGNSAASASYCYSDIGNRHSKQKKIEEITGGRSKETHSEMKALKERANFEKQTHTGANWQLMFIEQRRRLGEWVHYSKVQRAKLHRQNRRTQMKSTWPLSFVCFLFPICLVVTQAVFVLDVRTNKTLVVRQRRYLFLLLCPCRCVVF